MLEDAITRKVKKYKPLIDLRNAMCNAFLVESRACFFVFALTTLGELSGDIFAMIDYLATRERHSRGNCSRGDWDTPGQRAAACKR